MRIIQSALLSVATLLALSTNVFSGEGKNFKKQIIQEESPRWIQAELSTGWDSLYMFRGVNVITNNTDYGSGIYWIDFNFTLNATENDSFKFGAWAGFGTQHTKYKELDVYATYTRTIGDLSLSLGYIFYYVIAPIDLYSHELNAQAAYTFDLGFMTLTPSLTYYFNIGPDNTEEKEGIAPEASSYLLARVDANAPLYKDIVALAPWIGFGTNFQYNGRLKTDGELAFFNGANQLEIGIGIPIKINSMISVYGYGAYSYAFYNLAGTTNPSTFWGGAKVVFSF